MAVEAREVRTSSIEVPGDRTRSDGLPTAITPETYRGVYEQGIRCVAAVAFLTEIRRDLSAQRVGSPLDTDHTQDNRDSHLEHVGTSLDDLLDYIRDEVAPPLDVDGPVDAMIEFTHEKVSRSNTTEQPLTIN